MCANGSLVPEIFNFMVKTVFLVLVFHGNYYKKNLTIHTFGGKLCNVYYIAMEWHMRKESIFVKVGNLWIE